MIIVIYMTWSSQQTIYALEKSKRASERKKWWAWVKASTWYMTDILDSLINAKLSLEGGFQGTVDNNS